MYKCNKCGAVFEETGIYYNPCPYGERIVYEELSCCPACESGDYEEIGEEDDEEDDSKT